MLIAAVIMCCACTTGEKETVIEESADTLEVEEESADATEPVEEVEEEEESGLLSMIFTGDVYPDESIRAKYDSYGIDGIMSESVQNIMNSADITMINEEFPFGTMGTPAEDKQYTFRVNPSYISMFHEMGVDIVTLANNHTLDYGADALEETFALLDEEGIIYSGAGDTYDRSKELETFEVNGIKVGILSASRVIPTVSWDSKNQLPGVFTTYDETALCEAIKEADEICDYVFVYVHWGIEKNTVPEDYERALATSYVSAGADLVIGSHPHVLQGMEFIDGVPVYYSLGNYIFHSTTDATMLVSVEADKDGIRTKIIPAHTSDSYLEEMSAEDASELYDYLTGISFDITIDEDGYVSAK